MVVALINAGEFAVYPGPIAVGWAKDATGRSYMCWPARA
jgi:hypothetical protein